jgi:hypothetical protein
MQTCLDGGGVRGLNMCPGGMYVQFSAMGDAERWLCVTSLCKCVNTRERVCVWSRARARGLCVSLQFEFASNDALFR